ncbi:MAG TPA: peptidylprolyl isomerase [Anaerolineales bacterium]|nr:peptidylprolyl isomerase [Anaerolineales bacterium]
MALQKASKVGSYTRWLVLCWLAVLVVGCNGRAAQTPASTAVPPALAEPTDTQSPPPASQTPVPPSATPVPMAAMINGEPIALADFQAELERFRQALGTELATGEQQRVLDDLIDQLLLAQAAKEAGFLVDEALLEERYQKLVSERGSEQSLLDWMAAHGYSEDTFRSELRRAIAAAWMRDRIAAEVPEAVEQVHARQILLYNSDEAGRVLEQLQAGEDFAELAEAYDPLAKGDLGWFPRGYLLDSKLDEVVFALEPGSYSEIVETSAGFHILQLIERDAQHPLAPDARQELQLQALQDWLAMQRNQSAIQIFVP